MKYAAGIILARLIQFSASAEKGNATAGIEALRSKLRRIFDSQGRNLKHDSLA